MYKPELLLPAGNSESFYAAVKGGADAVFMGLKSFNARGKATNFSTDNLLAMLKIAKDNGVKIYITLNTVIKNSELSKLIDVLYLLSQTGVSAIIIQDWGVYLIAKRYFPELVVHASTQMANHNSLGASFSKHKGFERVIMARELTLPEIKDICKKSDIEIELFTHGALCYSFSGICLFSSYLGGQGANRGLCTQPCRRRYKSANSSEYTFSLKDNQIIDFVPELAKLNVASLKIEGRMKSDEYVHRVAKAYRMVIDDHSKIDDAKRLLQYDFGREKTEYFVGNNVSDAITEHPNTGVYLGLVSKVNDQGFLFSSEYDILKGYRLRIYSHDDSGQKSVKVKDIEKTDGKYLVKSNVNSVKKGDKVFLAGIKEENFSSKLPESGERVNDKLSGRKKKFIFNNLCKETRKVKEQLFVRIDSVKWLRKLRLEDLDTVVLNFAKREWSEFRADSPFLLKNVKKIVIELPKFIPEGDIEFYKKLVNNLFNKGYRHFMLSHISQKLLLPKGAIISTNENVYVYNDAASEFLRSEGCRNYTYPLENELENLTAGKDRHGIVPLYFYPELFYSRMPVKVKDEENIFEDDKGYKFRKITKSGITIVIPLQPVALLQYIDQLKKAGFSKFMIDLSHIAPSQNIVKTILKRYNVSQQIQPSTTFNFKKGMK